MDKIWNIFLDYRYGLSNVQISQIMLTQKGDKKYCKVQGLSYFIMA